MGALLLVIYLLFLKQFFITPFYSPKIRKLRKIVMTFGLFSILSSAGIALMNSIDSLMLAGLMRDGMHYAGIYTTAMFITSVMLIPYRSMLKISSPIVSQFWKEKNLEKMEELYKKFTLTNLIIGGFVFLLLWANIDNIFRFMPADYASGKYVFLFIGLGRFIDMVCGLNGIILLTSKKYRYDLFFILLLIFTMIGFNYLFIKVLKLGINGAAIATMLCVIIYNLLRIGFVQYHFQMHPFQWKNLQVVTVATICLIVNNFISYMGNLYLDAAVRTLIIGGLFIFPIWLFKVSLDINSFAKNILRWINFFKNKSH
jgi:O-antigen/teichoic acid export membrane protein